MSEYKILVPLDGSRLSERALTYLPALRNLGDCSVRLVSVVDQSEEFEALTPIESGEREFNVLATYLREVSADISKHLGINAESKVLLGKPADVIVEEAQDFAPNLIVLSTHGRSGISRWRMGSVADKVVRTVQHNTLVIGPKAAAQGKWLEADLVPAFQSILVPLDGSGLAQNALGVASRFAEAYKSEIHLVRVVPIPTMADSAGVELTYMPDMLDMMVSAARSYISGAAAQVTFPVKTDVLIGQAAYQLEDYIKAHNIALVVMTSHGRSGIVRTALGSVTDRLLGGDAPVLVVHQPV